MDLRILGFLGSGVGVDLGMDCGYIRLFQMYRGTTQTRSGRGSGSTEAEVVWRLEGEVGGFSKTTFLFGGVSCVGELCGPWCVSV